MSKSALQLALLAGTMFSTTAMAQMVSIDGGRIDPVQIHLDEHGNVINPPTYSNRAVGVTYGNYIFDSQVPAGEAHLLTAAIGTGIRHAIEDISFTPGPWAVGANHTITSFKITIKNELNNPPAAGTDPTIRIRFIDRANLNFFGQAGEGTDMMVANAPVVATLNLGLPDVFPNNGNFQGFVYNLGTPLTIPHGDYVLDMAIIDFTTGNFLTTDSYRFTLTSQSRQGQVGTTPGNPASPGFTAENAGNDKGYDGIFTGGAINGATNDHIRLGFNYLGSYRNVGLDFAIIGDIPATQPACNPVTLGADNTFASVAVNATAAPVWRCVTLTSDATDANLKYLDIDTEGSTINTAIAIFDSEGNVIAQNDDSGSGTNAQLSFGMGRRAAVGDGEQYDGRHWNDNGATPVLGLAAGTYWIAVVPSDTASPAAFSAGFTAIPGGTATGAATLRVRTNASTGALEPSVAPLATRITTPLGDDPLVAPGGESAAFALNGPAVRWFDFRTCVDATAAEPVLVQGTGDWPFSLSVFDSSGNQISTVNGTDGVTADVNLTANPAGTYYGVIAYDQPPDFSPSPATDGRWHVRGRDGDAGFEFTFAVFVTNTTCGTPCPGNECGPQDYNGDGDSGTDQDIEAFFACLGGTCCETCFCQGSDFNGDGDFGTDQDIEAFFRVLGGNPC
ncbi:MAG TPA: hypothetical protein VD997_03545 [Phycisphaerales bacterium]|nr:hypothetical protein [Phycisphaerales bacterium]